MPNFNIQPLGNIIQLEIAEQTAGALTTQAKDSAVEYAKVIAIPQGFTSEEYKYLDIGSYVFVKAWAIDIINHEGQKYYFCNLDTKGVLAIVH